MEIFLDFVQNDIFDAVLKLLGGVVTLIATIAGSGLLHKKYKARKSQTSSLTSITRGQGDNMNVTTPIEGLLKSVGIKSNLQQVFMYVLIGLVLTTGFFYMTEKIKRHKAETQIERLKTVVADNVNEITWVTMQTKEDIQEILDLWGDDKRKIIEELMKNNIYTLSKHDLEYETIVDSIVDSTGVYKDSVKVFILGPKK